MLESSLETDSGICNINGNVFKNDVLSIIDIAYVIGIITLVSIVFLRC